MLETEQTATYWPQVFLTIAALLSHSAGMLIRGSLRAQAFCLELVLTASNCNSNSNCNWLQLTQTVCGTWLYNCLTPTWASQLQWIQPVHRSRWYPDIFDRMHLLFTQVHLLTDSSVAGQYVTHTHTHTHTYIYIYILHGSVYDPDIHALYIHQTEWKVFKKG